jgi:acetolactate synthase I/II/III large subunit
MRGHILANAVRVERGTPPSIPQATLPTTAYASLAAICSDVHPLVPVVAGGNVMPLIEAAYAVGLRPIHPRSEAGAGFLANGIAWESLRPVLCIVITSAGVYGLMQALHAAFVNRRPVLVLSGEVSATGYGAVQAGDGWDGPSVIEVTRPLTVWSFHAGTPDLAVRAVKRAVALAREQSLPVHLDIPLAVQKSVAP